MNTKDKIIVALDTDLDNAVKIINELKDRVGYYKINSLYISDPEIIDIIKQNNAKIFLDLKFHDIPNTVANYISSAVKKGVDIITIHSAGGTEMMKAAAVCAKKTAEQHNIKKPLILGITLLTSIDETIAKNELNISLSLNDQIVHLAKLAVSSGLDGIVCSPKEIELIRKNCGNNITILTPGIRPQWSEKNDQKRISTPKDAIKKGSDLLVIGRPITQAENMTDAVEKIIEEIDSL